jgi:ABC-type transporter Mla subunit MlaD
LTADEDPELAPAMAQLNSHLESIRGNIKQVEGIADTILEAHSELDGVLRSRRTTGAG